MSADLARSNDRKELHTTLLYALAAVALGVASVSKQLWFDVPAYLLFVPIALTLIYGHRFQDEARLAEERTKLERRAGSHTYTSQFNSRGRTWRNTDVVVTQRDLV